jgi:hypothetical protein
VAWLGAGSGLAGCGGSQSGEVMPPVMTTRPDDFVMRDVRKDAARRMDCQVPNVDAELGPWAGQEGNVTAFGCGYRLTYYLRCITNHQCSMTISE